MAVIKLSIALLVAVAVTQINAAATRTKTDLTNICLTNKWKSGNYPNPNDCHSFIECSNGVSSVMPCNNGLVYDPVKKVCQHPNLAPACDTDPTTKRPLVIHEQDICREKNYKNGIYADPFDCNMYIQCVSQITYVMACDSVQHFDPVLKICRDPALVKCDTDTSP